MACTGLRLLSLDGGGTRGLSTLYLLREVMGSVSEDVGNLRPAEYFDLIAGSGLSGLCALLFVRFSYTINQAIEFLQELTQQLDDVENLRLRVLNGNVDSIDDWLSCMNKSRDPVEQLAELRQGIVQDAWSDVIKSNITGALERYPHMENGGFDFKNPSAKIEAGRSKAFAVSSESQGYGEDGGFSDTRRYNVPLLHRTYDCRHGRSLYTLYAVGLATVASPGIVNPGVVFPDFLATGRHTAHNPVRLILEESSTLWPGLPVGALLSIGVAPFEIDEGILGALSIPAAETCLEIYRDNQRLAKEVQRFVLPHDKRLARSYYRFDIDAPTGFLEYGQRDFMQASIKEWVSSPRGATKCATLAKILKDTNLPTIPEDSVALAALASLLQKLVLAGYSREAAIVNDVISNFMLYETAAGEDGSFQKAVLTSTVAKLADRARLMRGSGNDKEIPDERESGGVGLLDQAVYGGLVEEDSGIPGGLHTLCDYAAGAYYALTVLRRGLPAEMEEPNNSGLFRKLWDLLDISTDIIQDRISQMRSVLDIITLAALCEAATTQVLRGIRGLAHNGPLIRHAHRVLLDMPLARVSHKLLEPITNFLSICIHLDSWSPSGDDSIVRLIDAGLSETTENWSLTNLAAERLALERRWKTRSVCLDLLPKCSAMLKRHARSSSMSPSDLLALSVQSGLFGVLRKVLREDTSIGAIFSTGSSDETPLHQVARLGFPHIMQAVIEHTTVASAKDLVDWPNAQGHTALHLACMHRAPKEVFHLLFMLDANVNLQCNQGYTALHYCFPDQKLLPPVYDDLISCISENALPTIIQLDKPPIYVQGACKLVEPRIYDFRVIISHLLNRGADMFIANNEGETPLHTAARYGWGDNLDVFFRLKSDKAEKLQSACLKLRDSAGLTVLDHTRKSKVVEGMDRGEDFISREMSKKGIAVPPASAHDLWDSRSQWVSMPIRRSRTPVQNESIEPVPVPKPSPRPVAQFLQPIVYQDPEFARITEPPKTADVEKWQADLSPAISLELSPQLPAYSSPTQAKEAQSRVSTVKSVENGPEPQQKSEKSEKSGLFKKLRKGK